MRDVACSLPRHSLQAAAASGSSPAADVALPAFVMVALVPGEKLSLNIFEPRYRLMFRRSMEGSRRVITAQGSNAIDAIQGASPSIGVARD